MAARPTFSAGTECDRFRAIFEISLRPFHDWRLALAAYNCGEGTVQKLLDRYKTQSYDDIAEHLPAETQMYVPRVEAVILQREGAKLEQLSTLQIEFQKFSRRTSFVFLTVDKPLSCALR